MLGNRSVYEEEHAIFRDTARRFASREIAPNFERWDCTCAGSAGSRKWAWKLA